MKIQSVLVLAAVLGFFQFGSIASATEVKNLPAGMSLEDIGGQYVSQKGDVVTVTVTEDKKAKQPDLFTKVYQVDVTVKFVNLDVDFEFNERRIEFKPDGAFTMQYSVECEDPGCEEFELSLDFRKAAKNDYAVSATLEYSRLIDDEGPAESQEQADEMCSYLGSKDVIEAVINDDQSLNCHFSEYQTELSKK